jgi:hypothetical protein
VKRSLERGSRITALLIVGAGYDFNCESARDFTCCMPTHSVRNYDEKSLVPHYVGITGLNIGAGVLV